MTAHLLAMLRTATPERPLPIDTIARETHLSPRQIKAAMASLRLQGHIIGARRRPPYGYYLATEDEREAALRAYEAQIWTSLRTLRAMAPIGRVRGLVGQMSLSLEEATS